MKIIADTLTDAEGVLTALQDFIEDAKSLSIAAAPFEIAAEGRTLPRFIAETTVALKTGIVKDFKSKYPSLAVFVVNGSGNSNNRLHSAMVNFDHAQRLIVANRYVLKDDTIRQTIYDILQSVVADLVVYTINEFKLYEVGDTGNIFLSVNNFCEKRRFTVDVFYGLLLQTLDDTGLQWYAYEPTSPMYSMLQEFDPAFATECEEAMFPLTDADAKRLVYGEVSIDTYRAKLNRYLLENKEEEKKVSPFSLVGKMSLEG